MKKKIIVLIAALAISVGFNLWFFGFKAWKAHERKIYLRGINDAVAQVIQQARQGELVINTGNEQLILVAKPKPEPEEPAAPSAQHGEKGKAK